jgi:hypothetical protein
MPWLLHAGKLVSLEDADGRFASMRCGDIHCKTPGCGPIFGRFTTGAVSEIRVRTPRPRR